MLIVLRRWGYTHSTTRSCGYGSRPSPGRRASSGLPRMPPGLIPILARGVDHAAVGLEELVRHLEDRKHQAALRTPGDMAAAGLAPDEFAGAATHARGRALLVDQRPFEHKRLLDIGVFMIGQHRARRKA